MTSPEFTFDKEANAWLSEPFAVQKQAEIRITLKSSAPVLTMRQTESNVVVYGQTPSESDRYKIHISVNKMETLSLATPVPVTQCYVIEL